MVRDGIIEKQADPQDMRQNRLTVTNKGREITLRCRTMFDHMDEQVYGGFTAEELEQLSSFLQRLINNLASDEVRNTSNHALMLMMRELEKSNLDIPQKEE